MNVSQKQTARKFVEYWTFQRGSEKGGDRQFWNSLYALFYDRLVLRVGRHGRAEGAAGDFKASLARVRVYGIRVDEKEEENS